MRYKFFFKIFFFSFIFLLPTQVFSQSIPLDKMSLRLVPLDVDADQLGTKTITINQTPSGLRVAWYSMVKQMDESAYYPTYKLKANRGMVELSGFETKTSFFHPTLWGNGYSRVDTALPLWIAPEYLELSGKEKRSFNVGILNNNPSLLRQAPDVIYDQVTFFQSLYDQYVVSGDVREGINLSKSDQKEVRKFAKEFFLVQKLAKTKSEIYINGNKTSYPSVIIGNDYFQIVAIDDPLNPLVINLKIFSDEAPRVFKESFKRFVKNFNFRVTQINW